MDLSQVEGLSELIDAETSVQLDQAQRVFEGFLGKTVAVWRSEVIDCKALIEASIDFVDEDVPLDLSDEILKKLLRIKTSIQKEIDGSFISEKINAQINRTRTEESSPKNTTLYFNILLETKDLLNSIMSLMEEYYSSYKK